MDTWEYLSFRLYWDANLEKWVRGDDKTKTGSVTAILNPLGGQGWELVALNIEYQEKGNVVGERGNMIVASWETTAYRAVFKRKR